MRPRPLSHRFIAALSSVLLLQLTLLGSGTLCPMRGSAAPVGQAMAAGDAMGTMAASSGERSDMTGAAGDCEKGGAPASNGAPPAPGACASMAACTVVVAVTAPVVHHVLGATAERRIAEPLSMAVGPSFAPAPPPPRA